MKFISNCRKKKETIWFDWKHQLIVKGEFPDKYNFWPKIWSASDERYLKF